MKTQPLFTASGAKAKDVDPPADARTIFTPSNASGVASIIVCSSPLKVIVFPALLLLAKNLISLY